MRRKEALVDSVVQRRLRLKQIFDKQSDGLDLISAGDIPRSLLRYTGRVSKYIHKSHNVSLLLYHIVCPAKYQRVVFTEEVDKKLKETCLEISKRYEITFIEIGIDEDHVHFLVQSVPMYSPKKIVQIIKSITAHEILASCPEVKKKLWGGEFWTDGYFISTVGQHGNEETIKKYIQNQGSQYTQLHRERLNLF
jgi:putative transposase